ncbi:PAS domain S-box-containing protein [Rhizobium sp. NFR07]|uniref:PAS domain S-box protein n=1 Tax=Rhizobium sp. NFR07 TaxID=1566262 RepID=UPI0008EE82D9|nr:PAS domain S-box protein [Rhizobium sp. NFR07]SFA83493.1 PAS domain S-box-containing protein [Rhizobium sp. NFR07]
MDKTRDFRQVHQIVSGLKEGVILVDVEKNILWVNEAAIAMHGVKRSQDLGKTIMGYRERFTLKYRNNHSVADGEHPVDRAVANKDVVEATLEVRATDDADHSWMHAIRCFPVRNQEEGTDYIAWIIQDETRRYEAEDRFEAAFNANPAPAVICRLSDLRYVRVNPGFLEMTGYSRNDLVGRTTYEIDILAFAERRDEALERLNNGRTIPQMEALVPLPDKTVKSVIVAGEPIEVAGEPCMLFTFADLEPLKKSQTVLKQSEERFSKAFSLSPLPTVIVRADNLEVLEANTAFLRLMGAAEEHVVGRNPEQLELWLDNDVRKAVEKALKKDPKLRNIDFRLKSKDGALVDCLLSSEEIKIDDIDCIMMVIQDITDRKRSEEELMTAIEAVMTDTSWFSRGVVEKLAALRHTSNLSAVIADARLSDLTEREQDVLSLICQGMNDTQMSERLKLSRNTVRNHVSSLYRKIGVNRRGAAILWAKERGIGGKSKT